MPASHAVPPATLGNPLFRRTADFDNLPIPGASCEQFAHQTNPPWIYTDRTAGRHCDHRDLDFAAIASRATGARGSPTTSVQKQPQADWPRAAQLPGRFILFFPPSFVSDISTRNTSGGEWSVHARLLPFLEESNLYNNAPAGIFLRRSRQCRHRNTEGFGLCLPQ